MAIRTDDEFETRLDDDLAWRRIELQSLVGNLKAAAAVSKESPATRGLCRAVSTMLYSHWEGYIKVVFDSYSELLHRRKPLVSELSDPLVNSHFFQLLKRMESGDLKAWEEVRQTVRSEGSSRLNLGRARLTETRSNLRYAVFVDILSTFGIDVALFSTRDKLIDVLLCDRRNEIAHGRAHFPPADEVVDLHLDVVSMMEEVRDVAIGTVRGKRYLLNAT